MSTQSEHERQFEAYKKDVEKRGKPFFPHAMFHDTVMSLVVVSVIIGMTVVWHETADGTEAGILGPEYTEKADPASVSVIPRPDWYFYFLFYLLRIFEWPVDGRARDGRHPDDPHDAALRGAVHRPLDRSGGCRGGRWRSSPPSSRRWRWACSPGRARRPPSSSPARRRRSPLEFQEANNLPDEALPGAELFAASGCLSCHTYAGQGQHQPRRARSHGGGVEEPRRPVADRPPDQPVEQVTGVADAVVRGDGRREPPQPRHLPRGLQGPSGIARLTERGDPLAGIESGTLAPEGVRAMFDRIAPVYDVMNHVMTAGLDRRWRRLTAESVVRPGDRVLDACCGTGDLALACVRAGAGSVVGLDFSPRMIERARRKSNAVAWVEGDALSLPFEEDAFDAATVGFGIRNVADLGGALRRAGARARGRRTRRDCSRSRSRRARSRPSTACGSSGSCRCSASRWRAAPRTRISRPACAASPARTTS